MCSISWRAARRATDPTPTSSVSVSAARHPASAGSRRAATRVPFEPAQVHRHPGHRRQPDRTGCAERCRPRTASVRPASSSWSPIAIRPAPRVPVTTVPAPRDREARSTHSRTRPSVARLRQGRRPAGRSAARSSARPAPVGADTGHRVEPRRGWRGPAGAGRRPAPRRAGSALARSARVTASTPCLMPQCLDGIQVFRALPAPALVGRDHQQHRRHRPDPGQHVGDEPLVAGHVDEGDLVAARASVVQA